MSWLQRLPAAWAYLRHGWHTQSAHVPYQAIRVERELKVHAKVPELTPSCPAGIRNGVASLDVHDYVVTIPIVGPAQYKPFAGPQLHMVAEEELRIRIRTFADDADLVADADGYLAVRRRT